MRLKQAIVSALVTGVALAGIGGFTTPVHAQLFDDICKKTPSATVCQEQSQKQTKQDNVIYGKNGILMKVTNLLAIVIGITAVFIIIVSGIRYIFSSGDAGSISTAKKSIIYALVGLVIALAARSIIAFVINRL